MHRAFTSDRPRRAFPLLIARAARIAVALPMLCASVGCRATTTRAEAVTTVPDREWTSTLFRKHVLVGRILDVARGRWIDEAELVRTVASARFVAIGEQHDDVDHHRIQARLVQAMVDAGRRPALVLEMLDETKAPVVARALAEHPGDADALARAVDWDHSGWPAWSMYRPVLAAALGARLPISCAGIERARTMALAQDGAAALDAGLVRELGLDAPLSEPDARALRDEIRDAHCGLLPESMLDAMAFVQRARDAVLAWHLVHDRAASGAVLIAGNGHVRSDRGATALAARVGGAPVLSIGLLEVERDWTKPAQYAAAFGATSLPFDYVWFTPRTSDTDHCSEVVPAAHRAPAPR